MIIPPSTYWPEIQRICRKYDVLICADEVIGGFGRTGEWFAHEYFGFEPDTISIAKGLTSGYIPMGGLVLSRTGSYLWIWYADAALALLAATTNWPIREVKPQPAGALGAPA